MDLTQYISPPPRRLSSAKSDVLEKFPKKFTRGGIYLQQSRVRSADQPTNRRFFSTAGEVGLAQLGNAGHGDVDFRRRAPGVAFRGEVLLGVQSLIPRDLVVAGSC